MSPARSEPLGHFRGVGRCPQSFPFPLDPQHPHGHLASPLPPKTTQGAPSQHRVPPLHPQLLLLPPCRQRRAGGRAWLLRIAPATHPQSSIPESVEKAQPPSAPLNAPRASFHPSLPMCNPCPAAGSCLRPLHPLLASCRPGGGRGRGTSLPPHLVPARRAQRVNDSHVKWLQMCGKVWGDRTAPLLTFTPPSLPLPPGAPRSTFHTRAGGGGEQSAWDGGGKRLGRGRQRDFILCCCLLPAPSTLTLRR